MALFVVMARFADTCGNESQYQHGFFEADSILDVQRVYPEGPFIGFKVYPVHVQQLPPIVQKPKKERHYQS